VPSSSLTGLLTETRKRKPVEVSGFGADVDVDGCRSLSASFVGGGEGWSASRPDSDVSQATELKRSSSRDGEPFIVGGKDNAADASTNCRN
jgi:hypothetical protein